MTNPTEKLPVPVIVTDDQGKPLEAAIVPRPPIIPANMPRPIQIDPSDVIPPKSS